MGKGRDFTHEELIKVKYWHGENVKTGEIARRLGRHPAAENMTVFEFLGFYHYIY